MKMRLRFALAISLALVVSLMAAGPSQGADRAWTTHHDDEGDDDDVEAGAACGTDQDCDDHNPCTKDKCHGKGGRRSGRCVSKPHETHHGQPIACDDGNACTSGDACHGAVCAGVNVPSGTACDDANACTRSDTCQAGSCTGSHPVDCAARDQCHVAGTCDPASGACSDPAAPDGTACTDTDSCSADVCGGGVCGLSGDLTTLIAFVSGRDDTVGNPFLTAEIYLMNPDGTNPVRVTNNAWGDSMPTLSPNGKGAIVFDSNRLRAPSEPFNTSDLFLMKHDGSGQTFLTRGDSPTWSPDSTHIAFHRSASGAGLPLKADPGAPTSDSDIFVASVCEILAGVPPTNITNSPTEIDDDAAWSPDGQKILWTFHSASDNPVNSPSKEIWVMNADGSGRVNLTNDGFEERAPTWSPDGTRVAYMCRTNVPGGTGTDFEICVMNADGSAQTVLTSNTVLDGTPSFSPDGSKIAFLRPVSGRQQLFVMNAADGSQEVQLTFPPGANLFPSYGEIKIGP
jgi:Tol biopolymer transport system component